MRLKSLLLSAAAVIALSQASTSAMAEMVIGTAGPTSNAEALFGTTWMNGMELAVEQFNTAGGIAGDTVRLQREDDAGDPRQGTLIAQKQCDDAGIVAVIANFNSGVTIPSSDVYNRCGLPQVTNASNPKVTVPGYKNLFRPIANDLSQGAAPADYAVDKGWKKAAIVHDKQAFGQGVAEVFRDTLTKGGGTVTSFSGVTATDVDFSALLTTIKQESPDVIYYGGTMPAIGLFVKQARELGITATFFGADSAFTPDFIAGAGPENAEGTLVSFQAPPYDSSPALQEFAKAYEAKFGEGPGPYSAYGYMEAQVILKAMTALGKAPTRADLVAEIPKTDFDSIVGNVKFTPNGELQKPFIFLYKATGGAFTLEK